MRHTFETVLGPLIWEADDQGLAVRLKGRHTRASWDDITAAGLVEATMSTSRWSLPFPPAAFSAVWGYLPGWNKVMQINETLAQDYRLLVLARGPSPNRAIRVPLPLRDAMTADLVADVQQHLSGRWSGEISLGESHKRLGQIEPWWTIPFTILLAVALGLMLVCACAGFAALEMRLQGQLLDLPSGAWIVLAIAMTLWLLLIGGIVLAYRRMWWR